jgi:hypothetical protein
MQKNILVIITLLSVAVAVGGISFGVRATNQKAKLQEEAQALRDQLNAPGVLHDREPASDDALVVALKEVSGIETNDVTSVQEQLAARDAELERLRAELAERQNRPQRESFQDRMARMKEEEPEQYAEMIKNRTEWQEKMQYDQANQLATFMDFDTSNMTPEELENHNLLIEKLSGIWEQTAAFDPEQPPDREAWGQIRETIREVSDLMGKERMVMLKQLGDDVGLSGTDAEEFAAYTDSIIEATTLRRPGGNRGPRGRN